MRTSFQHLIASKPVQQFLKGGFKAVDKTGLDTLERKYQEDISLRNVYKYEDLYTRIAASDNIPGFDDAPEKGVIVEPEDPQVKYKIKDEDDGWTLMKLEGDDTSVDETYSLTVVKQHKGEMSMFRSTVLPDSPDCQMTSVDRYSLNPDFRAEGPSVYYTIDPGWIVGE